MSNDSNRPGYCPNGDGLAKGHRTQYGCDPEGRAYNKDGTLRKSREAKSPAEQLQAIADAERRAHAGMGRKVLATVPTMAAFLKSFGTFRRWVREAKAATDVEARRAYYQRMLDTVDAKADAGQTFLDNMGNAVEQANGVFAKVGAAYAAWFKANGAAPEGDDLAGIIADAVDADAVARVASASDPANDPFAEYRRDTSPEASDDADEDDDTL